MRMTTRCAVGGALTRSEKRPRFLRRDRQVAPPSPQGGGRDAPFPVVLKADRHRRPFRPRGLLIVSRAVWTRINFHAWSTIERWPARANAEVRRGRETLGAGVAERT